MEKQRNAFQNWVFFTTFLFLSLLLRSNRTIVFESFHTWTTPYSIPIIAIVLVLLIRIGITLGDWLASSLKKSHVPAWILFAATTIAFFWISSRR